MKMKHKTIIERAERNGLLPSELASELLVHDLVNTSLFELRNLKATFSKLNQEGQQEVIERVTEKAQMAVQVAIAIIASRGSITIPCEVKRIQVDAKNLTVTSTVDGKDPNRHGLTDSAGSLCLLVIAPEDYSEGLDFIQPDRDQAEMALSVSDRLSSMFSGRSVDKATGEIHDPEFAEVGEHVAHDPDVKEFGEFTYQDASQLVVLHAAHVSVEWLQHRLAIDSDKATSLILQLLDNNVIVLEKEAEDRIDNIYKVTAQLDDLDMNLE